jgi:hypothetical protein
MAASALHSVSAVNLFTNSLKRVYRPMQAVSFVFLLHFTLHHPE